MTKAVDATTIAKIRKRARWFKIVTASDVMTVLLALCHLLCILSGGD